MQAFARRESGTVVVYVSAGLSAVGRLAAIRKALAAAPQAGWRSPRSSVLLPALVGGAGFRRAPEGRWVCRALTAAAAAAVVVTVVVVGATLLHSRPPLHGATGPPAALLPAGPSASGPWPGRSPGPLMPSSPAQPGSAPGEPSKRTATAGAPSPESSGTPSPVPTATATRSPQPSWSPTPSPSPGPSRSPRTCVDVLGVTICLP